MKKTRTLKIHRGYMYYRGIKIGFVVDSLKTHFGLHRGGKVRISIEEKGPYRFGPDRINGYYDIYKNSEYITLVCRKEFERFFFKPDGRKGYDITVKRVKK